MVSKGEKVRCVVDSVEVQETGAVYYLENDDQKQVSPQPDFTSGSLPG